MKRMKATAWMTDAKTVVHFVFPSFSKRGLGISLEILVREKDKKRKRVDLREDHADDKSCNTLWEHAYSCDNRRIVKDCQEALDEYELVGQEDQLSASMGEGVRTDE